LFKKKRLCQENLQLVAGVMMSKFRELPVAGEQPGIGRLYHISDVRAMAEIVEFKNSMYLIVLGISYSPL
jgi:hypothetical protein